MINAKDENDIREELLELIERTANFLRALCDVRDVSEIKALLKTTAKEMDEIVDKYA